MRDELEEVREKIHERIRINHSIGWRRYFCRIFLNFGRQRQIFDCLPSIAKILVDTAESIAMSLLSFAKLFTNHRRDSSHGSIYHRRIDVSICRLRPDCRRPDIRGTLLPRTLSIEVVRKLISDRSAASPLKRDNLIDQTIVYARFNDT